jgi:hypothetical protein
MAVPKPDAANLGSESLEMAIDMDLTLEAGRDDPRSRQNNGQLFIGDVHGTTSGHN